MLRSFLKSRGVAQMLRRVGVAPAPRSRFLVGQRWILLHALDIRHVLDVGANAGQYGQELRASGFSGELHSFEPGAEAYAALDRRAGGDAAWWTYPVALGDHDAVAELHNWPGQAGESATLLAPGGGVTRLLGAGYKESVTVQTLSAWLSEHEELDAGVCLLKLDVQGSERAVLDGAGDHLGRFPVVELEAPLVPWYVGQATLIELIERLAAAGFVPASIVTERFHAEWLGAPDVDVLFIRSDLSRIPR